MGSGYHYGCLGWGIEFLFRTSEAKANMLKTRKEFLALESKKELENIISET